MLEGLLLLVRVFAVGLQSVDIQAHATRNAALPAALGQTSLWVNDRLATLSSLDKLGVLLLENGEVLLGFPIPDAVRGEEKVHFLKSALVGLGVQAVDHGQSNDVGDTEDVVSLLLESLEDDWKEEREPPVTDRPANDTPGVTLGTNLQWEDLSRVQPWNSEPGSAECSCEEEDHSNSTGAGAFGSGRPSGMLKTNSGEPTSEEHRDTLDD